MIFLTLSTVLAVSLALSRWGAFAWLEGRLNISGYAIFLFFALWLLWIVAILLLVVRWYRSGIRRGALRNLAAAVILVIPLTLSPS